MDRARIFEWDNEGLGSFRYRLLGFLGFIVFYLSFLSVVLTVIWCGLVNG